MEFVKNQAKQILQKNSQTKIIKLFLFLKISFHSLKLCSLQNNDNQYRK